MEYHIFNPDTEMSLASGNISYTPPAAVCRFTERLSLLPALYAPEKSILLSTSSHPANLPYYKIAIARGMKICGVRNIEDYPVIPWGWNLALKARLARAGKPRDTMPTDSRLDTWRGLAHRSTTIQILGYFDDIERRGLMPQYFQDKDAAAEFATRRYGQGGGIVMKLPWSSSGRGVFFNPDTHTIRNAMSRQGGVMIEPLWEKTFDYASEWECSQGNVRFRGFSVFRNEGQGKYGGNVVASGAYLKALICRYCDEKCLDGSISTLQRALENVVAPYYEGPLGVDMLCDRNREIHPCVEMNLRMTMGHVALRMYELFGLPDEAAYRFCPGMRLPFE